MKYYETLYIVRPDLEGQDLDTVRLAVDQRLGETGATVINSYPWGKRKLARPILKQEYGTFILLQYGTERSAVDEITGWMKLNPAILSHLTVRLGAEPPVRTTPPPSMEAVPAGEESDRETVEGGA